MTNNKICPQCNEKENDSDERFCISCGMDLNEIQSSSNADNLISESTSKTNADPESSEDNCKNQINESTLIIQKAELDCNGRLVLLSDNKIIIAETVDKVQRLVGRADLMAFTEKNPDLISRSHFTIYRDGGKHMICDGITNVQDMPSKHGTNINDKVLKQQIPTELKVDDKISVSDVIMQFKVE